MTSYVSASVIRTALLSVVRRSGGMMVQPFLDTVADLIGTASKLSSSQTLSSQNRAGSSSGPSCGQLGNGVT